MRVLLAFADVGLSFQIQESLEAVGLESIWDATAAAGPVVKSHGSYDTVVVDSDALGPKLAAVVSLWRTLDPAPAIVAMGMMADTPQRAEQARIASVRTDASAAALRQTLEQAVSLRFSSAMTRGLARAALELPAASDPDEDAAKIVLSGGRVDPELARNALRYHTFSYVTLTDVLTMLRQKRALQIPEVQFCAHIDGTTTVQTLLRKGPIDPWHALKFIWVLASVGAVTLTASPVDSSTPRRRALVQIRDHLAARMKRLEGSTFFDVLEINSFAEPEDIETAYALVARRFAPQILAQHDLGDVGKHIEAVWQLTEKARSVLTDMSSRGRYNDWIQSKGKELRSQWLVDNQVAGLAHDAYTRGQAALAEGDVPKAVGELAAACRQHPGHPEYETGLLWARYRMALLTGKDKAVAAKEARDAADTIMAGLRPWPRAILAHALLCAADNDIDCARYYLREALAADPGLIAAQQLLQRLA